VPKKAGKTFSNQQLGMRVNTKLVMIKTHDQIDHNLVERRRHSNALDVRSVREADCDTDHNLVVAKFRERLAVSKQRMHRLYMDRFNIKKLKEVQGK
jgi:hypothetical protein